MGVPISVINKVLEHANNGEPWDEGDQATFVLNDAVVVVSMKGCRELNVNVIVGKPEHLDLTLGF